MTGIIQYGAGNIFSLTATLDRAEIPWKLISRPEELDGFDRYIIPGVGHAGAAMEKLQSTGMVPLIKNLQKPVLGICVGMQLLSAHSEEGNADLLDIVPLQTRRFPEQEGLKVPHTGWNSISWDKPSALFSGIDKGTHMYFVHSYFIEYNPTFTAAFTEYGPRFSAAVQKGNFFGVQFHPEKSGEPGGRILKNFSELK
ncbi:MAG: imidazole glycerol phosphate synthase subunit HisH [Mucilaginibacter polytrichastri]|nr:imidazole glycerol phosphate synthase subunit HisH [Mucilaginibacter polytrichastri]